MIRNSMFYVLKVQASVTQTVFDQNPLAIFGVSKVLLPREYFGRNPIEVNKPPGGGGAIATAHPPDIALSPGNSPEPNRLSTPQRSDLRLRVVGEVFERIGV